MSWDEMVARASWGPEPQPTPSKFLNLLQKVVTFKVAVFGKDSEDNMVDDPKVRDARPVPAEEANIASSLLKTGRRSIGGRRHIIAIDIDHPAILVDSSTPGHHHLYVDIPGGIPEGAYVEWLEACVKIGLVQPLYVEATRTRGHSDLRLPWVAKHAAGGQRAPYIKPTEADFTLAALPYANPIVPANPF